MEQIEDKQQNKSFNFNVDMNKQQATMKRAYVKPEIEVIKVDAESLLQTASGNAGTIGQGSQPAAGSGQEGSPDPSNPGYTPWGD